ncbi:MAG TPA: hydroxyisourate hydrolase [Verrucomicrobiae bacterium]|nr:hydroxyisourate hydrolase [Verrucomicrobiae bacterium]
MTGISTHVLDLTRGKPASHVPVRLERQDASGNWQLLNSATTDADGRCPQLLGGNELQPGLYRLSFDTASYFAGQGVEPLHPLVAVTFQVRSGESRFHIPLLLTANGYTTYRGS